jgi:hypothetical protein
MEVEIPCSGTIDTSTCHHYIMSEEEEEEEVTFTISNVISSNSINSSIRHTNSNGHSFNNNSVEEVTCTINNAITSKEDTINNRIHIMVVIICIMVTDLRRDVVVDKEGILEEEVAVVVEVIRVVCRRVDLGGGMVERDRGVSLEILVAMLGVVVGDLLRVQ